MPQFSSYPPVVGVKNDDLFLMHSIASGSERTIKAVDLADQLLEIGGGLNQGPQGPPGPPGDQGATGPAGPTGATGIGVALTGNRYAYLMKNISGTITDSSGSIWVGPSVVNVKHFGAVGDGVSNDTTAVNAALTEAMATSPNSSLYFPQGVYNVAGSLTIPNSTNRSITIFGDGFNVSIIKQTTIGGTTIDANFLNSSTEQPRGIIIRGLGFTSSVAATTAISISYGTPASTSTHRNNSVLIDSVNIRSDGNAGNWTNGIIVESAWNTNITNCFISGDSKSGVWTNMTGDGILFKRLCANSTISNTQVCFFENGFRFDAGGTGATDANTEGLTFSNCIFTATRTGVKIVANAAYSPPRVAGFCWTGGLMDLRACIAGFELTRVEDVQIGNTFIVQGDASGTNTGILLNGCSSVLISKTDFFAIDYGVADVGGDAVLVKHCTFRGGSVQASFSTTTTNSFSGEHTLYDLGTTTFYGETNAGGSSNRIYQGYDLGCRAVVALAGFSVPDSADTAIDFDSANYDPLEMWSGTNPARITIPAGTHWIRITANVIWEDNGTGARKAFIVDNNGLVWALDHKGAGGYGSHSITTGLIKTTAETYFELHCYQTSGAPLSVLDRSSLTLEVIG